METNVLAQDVYSSDCPSRQILNRIGDKWTPLVVHLLEDGPKRFSELQRSIGGISHKMLTQTLRALERDGLATRTMYPEIPPRVEYTLSPLGQTLSTPIATILRWAEDHIAEVTMAQSCYDARDVKATLEHK